MNCFYSPRTLEEQNASILVYKQSPERTGFNMYAENTQQQLTFFVLLPCSAQALTFVYSFQKLHYTLLVNKANSKFYNTCKQRYCKPGKNINELNCWKTYFAFKKSRNIYLYIFW